MPKRQAHGLFGILISTLLCTVGPSSTAGERATVSLLRDINPRVGSTAGMTNNVIFDSSPNEFLVVGEDLYFSAAGTNGSDTWTSDGTPGGTTLIPGLRPPLNGSTSRKVQLGSLLLFNGNGDGGHPVHRTELWKHDLATHRTEMVRDIEPIYDLSSNPGRKTVYKQAVYFAATTRAAGRELWKSDGTSNGTVLVKDIRPGGYFDAAGGGHSDPMGLTVMGDHLYFNADDGVSGRELWRTDGTTTGTVMVADISPGSGSGVYVDSPWYKHSGMASATYVTESGSQGEFTIFQGQLYFTGGTNGIETGLWRSDGTQSGTARVKNTYRWNVGDPYPKSQYYRPKGLRLVGSNLLFRAWDPVHGDELWRSDGTEAGTVLVKDIAPGSANSVFRQYFAGTSSDRDENLMPADEMVSTGDLLFFAANDLVHGQELWISDGTAEGTKMVKDIWPYTLDASGNPMGSNPDGLRRMGNQVLFVANYPPDMVNPQLPNTFLGSATARRKGRIVSKALHPTCGSGTRI